MQEGLVVESKFIKCFMDMVIQVLVRWLRLQTTKIFPSKLVKLLTH